MVAEHATRRYMMLCFDPSIRLRAGTIYRSDGNRAMRVVVYIKSWYKFFRTGDGCSAWLELPLVAQSFHLIRRIGAVL